MLHAGTHPGAGGQPSQTDTDTTHRNPTFILPAHPHRQQFTPHFPQFVGLPLPVPPHALTVCAHRLRLVGEGSMSILQFVQSVLPALILLNLAATLVITIVTLSETDEA
jgi:hypothetical protein